jgi:hypothetical protein
MQTFMASVALAMNVPVCGAHRAGAAHCDLLRRIFLADEPFVPIERCSCITAYSTSAGKIMMRRAQYFVTKRNGEWKIRAGYRYSGPYPSKGEALRVAIDFAERDGQAGREAQVLVQGEDRLFRPAWTYGRDPYPIETRRPADFAPAAGSSVKVG